MCLFALLRSCPSSNSKRSVEKFTKVIADWSDEKKVNVVCGDMNLHFHPQTPCDNHLTSTLYEKGFVQLVKEATHIQGHILDHVYVRACPKIHMKRPLYQLHYPYYSDHDAVLLILRKKEAE